MPAAIPLIAYAAVETGVAAAIGTAIVGSTVSAGVATAVGAGIVSGGVSALQGNDADTVLKDALIGGIAPAIGSEIASGVSQSLVDAGVDSAVASVAGSAAAGATKAGLTGADPLMGALTSGALSGGNQIINALQDQATVDAFNDATAQQLANENLASPLPTEQDVLSAMGDVSSEIPDTSLPVTDVAEVGGLPSAPESPFPSAFPESPVDSVVADSGSAPEQSIPQDQIGESTSTQLQPELPGALPTDATQMFGEAPTETTDVGALPLEPALPAETVETPPVEVADMGGALPVEPPVTVADTSLTGTESIDEPYMTAGTETPPVVDQTTTAETPTSPKFNLSSALKAMGALGAFGSMGGGYQSPMGGLQATTQGAQCSGIPWLDTSPQMLAGKAPVRSSGAYGAPRGAVPVGVDYVGMPREIPGIEPELLSAFQDRGIGLNLASGGDVRGYAVGDLVGSCLAEAAKSFASQTPKFYTVKCAMLTSPAARKNPLTLLALKQLQPHLSVAGNIGGMAKGGLPAKYQEAAPDGHNPEFITGITGYYAGGRGTGQSDDIPAMLHDGDYVIDAEAVSALGDGSSKAGNEVLMDFMKRVPHRMSSGGNPVPAKIADGEVVLPESFVTALGGGDNKRGARMLDQMRQHLREHKRSAPNSRIPPKAKTPMEYLRGVKG